MDARPAPSLSIISWNDASSERNTHVPQKKGERKVRARRRHAPILLARHDALFFAIISVRRHTVEGTRLSFRTMKRNPSPLHLLPRDAKGTDRKRIEEVFPSFGTQAGNDEISRSIATPPI